MKLIRFYAIFAIFSSCANNRLSFKNNNMEDFKFRGEFSYTRGMYPTGKDEFNYSSTEGVQYTSSYPVRSDLVEAILSDSNFDFSESMLNDLLALVFAKSNSDCPDGSSFKEKTNNCSKYTVGPGGELWFVEVKKVKDSLFNFRLTRKSKFGKYPDLVRVG